MTDSNILDSWLSILEYIPVIFAKAPFVLSEFVLEWTDSPTGNTLFKFIKRVVGPLAMICIFFGGFIYYLVGCIPLIIVAFALWLVAGFVIIPIHILSK